MTVCTPRNAALILGLGHHSPLTTHYSPPYNNQETSIAFLEFSP
jgi:hypothetical protein